MIKLMYNLNIKVKLIKFWLFFTLVIFWLSPPAGSPFARKNIRKKVLFLTAEKNPLRLEGILSFHSNHPEYPLVILCHPHPLQGGSLNSAVITAVEAQLLRHKFSTLKFNFRGVGQSEGFYGQGILEERDLEGAIKFGLNNKFIKPERLFVVGYSFGAVVSLKVALKNEFIVKLVTIGLPTRYLNNIRFPVSNHKLKICFIAGEKDKKADNPAEIEAFGNRNSLDFKIISIAAADHFFRVNLEKLSQEVADFLKK